MFIFHPMENCTNSNQWSQLDLHYPSHHQEILNTLAYIHRHASILSKLACNGREQIYSESQVEGALLAPQAAQRKPLPAEAYSMLQIEDPFSDDSDSDGTLIFTFGAAQVLRFMLKSCFRLAFSFVSLFFSYVIFLPCSQKASTNRQQSIRRVCLMWMCTALGKARVYQHERHIKLQFMETIQAN